MKLDKLNKQKKFENTISFDKEETMENKESKSQQNSQDYVEDDEAGKNRPSISQRSR